MEKMGGKCEKKNKRQQIADSRSSEEKKAREE
jgi:hypothetical protein